MRCPFCSHEETQVVETRESEEGDVIRRRRRCLHCEKRFTTYERSEIALPAVVKKDGARVEFDPAKPRASMMLALRKRPVSVEQVAYVRFASVYREFEDVDAFRQLIRDI